MSIADTIRARASKFEGDANFAPMMITVSRALAVHAGAVAARDAVTRDDNLTPIGRAAEMRRHVAEKVAPYLLQCQKSVELIAAKLTASRAKLGPPPPDKTNAAAAVVRMEIRNMLRALPSPSARAAMLLASEADPRMIEAAIEGFPALSGISDQIRAEIIKGYIEKHHEADLSRLEQAEEALELARAATDVAAATLCIAGEFATEAALSEFVAKAVGKDKATNIALGVDQEFATALT